MENSTSGAVGVGIASVGTFGTHRVRSCIRYSGVPRAILFATVFGMMSQTPATAQDDDHARRAAMIDRIDQLLLQASAREGMSPSPVADDSEFIRRVCLDLSGAIPAMAQVRDFLDDSTSDKRNRLIDTLLAQPSYAIHMATVWRDLMLPANANLEQFGASAGLHSWLRRQFSDNLRYDRLVSDVIATSGGEGDGPAIFFTAQELDAKKLAASSARIFLGVQIQCAECHDHPFDVWTQRDFWSYAAFFARLPKADMQRNAMSLADMTTGEVTLPDTTEVVLPKYPGGNAVEQFYGGTRRQQLSIWMASSDNPYLARAAVNRVWSILLGRGLVNPVDDLGPHNPATHPELLDELSQYFVSTGYDLRELFRTVANTQAYQRSSMIAGDAPTLDSFAAMPLKVLSAEQLFDSLSRCLMTNNVSGPSRSPLGLDPARQVFIARMRGSTRDATEYQAGLQQALTMMNGQEVSAATSLMTSSLLTSLEAPFLTDPQRLEILFLATLSRRPTSDEVDLFAQLRAQAGDDPHALSLSLADVLWAMLNSAEFALNH